MSPADRELPQLPALRQMLALSGVGWAPMVVLGAVLAVMYSLALTARYGFLDDYSLLYQLAVEPSAVSDHILGGGRPLFALAYRTIVGQVDGISGLRWVRATSLVTMWFFGLLLYQLLRCAAVGKWSAIGIVVIVLSLPCYQVAAAWATMFIMPSAAIFGLAASLATARLILERQGARLHLWLLPLGLLAMAMLAYQPGAMTYWIGFAVIMLGPRGVLADSRLASRLSVATAAVMLGGLSIAFIAVRLGVASQDVRGERSRVVTDIPAKLDWFMTEVLPRAFDPWSLTPRPLVAIAVALFAVAGLALGTTGWRRVTSVAVGAMLLPAAYLPNMLSAENWASTRTMVTLMPMVAVLVALGGLALLRAMPWNECSAARAGAVILCLGGVAFAIRAQDVVDRWFVDPQVRELDATERAVREVRRQGSEVHVVPANWYDSIAPSEHYDEFGIPSSVQAAVGLTQLIWREQTGRFADVAILDREQLPVGPSPVPVLDYSAVLAGA